MKEEFEEGTNAIGTMFFYPSGIIPIPNVSLLKIMQNLRQLFSIQNLK